MTENYNYKCNFDKKLTERCTFENDGDFENKEDCENMCFSYEELKALSKIANLFSVSKIKKPIDPDSFTNEFEMERILNSIKEIPLFYKDGKPYNNKLLNELEIKKLYQKLSHINFKNDFLIDIIKKSNSITGTKFMLWEREDENGDFITTINIYDDTKFTDNFLLELKKLKDDTNINYLVKEFILIGQNNAHALLTMCKYNATENTYEFFAFDPSNQKINIYLTMINNYITDKISKKLEDAKIVFVNLSAFYGIQNFELINFLDVSFMNNSISFLTDRIEALFKKYIDEFHTADNRDLYYDIFDSKMINEIKKNYKESMKKKFASVYENNDKDFIEISDKLIDDYFFSFSIRIQEMLNVHHLFDMEKFINKLRAYKQEMIDNFILYNTEINKLKNDVFIKNKLDNYNMLCYAWCCYICILMLINPKVNSYNIIKFAFYQTAKPKEMKEIYKEFRVSQKDETFKKLTISDFLSKEKTLEKIKQVKEYKNKVIEEFANPALIVHHKMLYQKITNLIFLMSKYNYLKNPKYFEPENPEDIVLSVVDTLFGPYSKMREKITKKFIKIPFEPLSIDYPIKFIQEIEFKNGYDSTNNVKILESVINGIKTNDLYELIIGLNPVVKPASKAEQKYLKYKQKYLQLKKMYNM